MLASVIALVTAGSASQGGVTGSGAVGAPTPLADAGRSVIARVSAPEKCSAHRAIRFYSAKIREYAAKMALSFNAPRAMKACPVWLAKRLQRKARAWRLRAERWHAYHYDWPSWLPAKWQRIGACETGYGRIPGDWRWNSGTYEGAFGFFYGSWDAFVPAASRKAGPYPHAAYLATPRQQYEVALAIWRRYGLSGWGCRNA